MDLPRLILTPAGILFILVGILYQYKPFIEWNIKWTNSLRGSQTKITKQSITAQKIFGIIFIILGIFLFVMGFLVIPSLTSSIYNQ